MGARLVDSSLRFQVLARLAVLALLALLTRTAHADPTRIRLHGSAHIDAHGARAEGEELRFTGTLRDDAGVPIPHETVAVLIARAVSPTLSVSFGDERRAPRSCQTGAHAPRPTAAGVLPLTTDERGAFCIRVSVPIDRYVAHVEWSGSTLIDGAKVDVPVDMSRRALTLQFEPEPRTIALGGTIPLALDAVASFDDNGTTAQAQGLALTLTNERGALLARGTTSAAGHVTFMIDPPKAGPPGRGELRIAYAGSADTAASTHVAEIERHTRVDLAVPDATTSPDGDQLNAGTPEEGVAFVVAVTSPSGEVPNGSVEARVGSLLVGAASVERGAAKLVVTFAADAASAPGGEVPIVLRYAPSAPWFEAGAERTIHLPVRGPSPWRQIPLVLAGLAVIAWFVLARTARNRELPAATPTARPQAKGEAKVDVVRVARDPRTGWSGRVVDAHDGDAVPNARVAIERPAFGQIEVVVAVIADADGRFELHPSRVESHAGDELVIEAPLHAALRQPVPPSGELDVALVLRKRALVARLVTWARQRGRPFDAKPEPTPGHVRRHAGKDFNLARWADAVERAAYAGDTIDATAEHAVDQLAPQPGPPSLPPSSPPLAAPMQQTGAAPTLPPKPRP